MHYLMYVILLLFPFLKKDVPSHFFFRRTPPKRCGHCEAKSIVELNNIWVCDFCGGMTALEPEWLNTPITLLSDKHLYNILQGLKRGTWKTGTKAKVHPMLFEMLTQVYESRELTERQEASFEGQNKEWERKKVEKTMDQHYDEMARALLL